MRQWTSARISFLAGFIALVLSACTDADRPSQTADQPCPTRVDWDLHSNASTLDPNCLNRLNLAKMVAQPSDLKTGRAIGPADGAREALGVTAYEQGKVKPFSSEQSMAPTVVVPSGTSGTP